MTFEETCKKVGRDSKEVTLICVSKTKPESDIIEAYNVGERNFGENKVQEMCEKHDDLNDEYLSVNPDNEQKKSA